MLLAYHLILFIIQLLIRTARTDSDSTELRKYTTPYLVASHGYPIEEHNVTTEDGYILTMHRIPHSSKMGNANTTRPVVFMMHGLLSSSTCWIITGPGKALAYLLSDKGFDIWLGNARGNVFSKAHVSLDIFSREYWNFEWHQIGLYDLPAMMKYVMNHTGVKTLRYFGHSQGSTTFFVLNSINTQFKNYIRTAHLLAPAVYMKHMASPLVKLGGILLGHPNPMVEVFGSMEFLPNFKELEILGSSVCSRESVVKEICSNVIFLLFGWDSPYLNESMLPDILPTFPAGSSLNQVLHYLQLYNSGEFRQFDYGTLRNIEMYGSSSPPKYNLRNIDVPSYVYVSKNDFLVSLTDAKRLKSELKPSILKRFKILPQENWNHIDFLTGINATEYLYNDIFADIENS